LTARAVAEKTDAMKIHLNRAGQSLGQFTPEEVRAGYREGKFNATDLAWRDGMASWRPLAEVIDEFAPDLDDGGVPPLPVVGQSGLPWEKRGESGFLASLFETIRLVLLEPKTAFAAMKPTGGLGAPLFFFVLVATVGGVAGIFYQTVLSSLESGVTPQEKAVAAMFGSTVAIGVTIMLLPVFLAALAFVSAGLVHLALIVVGGAKRPFEATFRVACYAGGATAVLQLLPVCGAIVASVWNFVCMVIGLSEVHGIGKGRATVAVLLPSIVCCGLLVAGMAALVMAVGGTAEFWQQVLEQAGKAGE
jgi:hypothetical protein